MDAATTEGAGATRIEITGADVTIRVINVGGKAMTLAVFEQLPRRDWEWLADHEVSNWGSVKFVGWINRCPRGCPAAGTARAFTDTYRHMHVLAALNGEPVLALLYLDKHRDTQRVLQRSGRWSREQVDAAIAEADMTRAIRQRWVNTLPQLYVAR